MEEAQEHERQRLFRLIEKLVLWENTTNEKVLDQAREEIRKSWRSTCAENQEHPRAKELFDAKKLPAFHDPNPVAVLINKAMIEIPPKFAGRALYGPRTDSSQPGFGARSRR